MRNAILAALVVLVLLPVVVSAQTSGELIISNFRPGSDNVADLDSTELSCLDSLMDIPGIEVEFFGTADGLHWLLNGQRLPEAVNNSFQTTTKLSRAVNLRARYGKGGVNVLPGDYNLRGVIVRWSVPEPQKPDSALVEFKVFDLDFAEKLIEVRNAEIVVMSVSISILVDEYSIAWLTGGGVSGNADTNRQYIAFVDTFDSGEIVKLSAGNYHAFIKAPGFETMQKDFQVGSNSKLESFFIRREKPQPVFNQKNFADFYGFGTVSNSAHPGVNGIVKFKHWLVGGNLEGIPGDESGREGYLGYVIPKLSDNDIAVALTLGYREESDLDGFWDSYGFTPGVTIFGKFAFLELFARGGFKFMNVERHLVKGPLQFEQTENLVRAFEPVIQPHSEGWQTDTYLQVGVGIHFNEN